MTTPPVSHHLDKSGRFVIENYNQAKAFASFLPGIAGPLGIPAWAFYVNRGQGICSFGAESKDSQIMEFQPADKAYGMVFKYGFRTFLRWTGADGAVQCHEPFQAADIAGIEQTMLVSPHGLEIRERCPDKGIETSVRYFIVPGMELPALARIVTVKNLSGREMELEILDGMPRIIPFGFKNSTVKFLSYTASSYAEVHNAANRVPFCKIFTAQLDAAEVIRELKPGNFHAAAGPDGLLPPFFDPAAVFEEDSSLGFPRLFRDAGLAAITARPQCAVNKTPCAFAGMSSVLKPDQTATLTAVSGHGETIEQVNRLAPSLGAQAFVLAKEKEAEELISSLTDKVATETALPAFDRYCRQTCLDNGLRGGFPAVLGERDGRPIVFHLYSRVHGDLERDYSQFVTSPEYYSQGNGHYRDINQNRRSNNFINPAVGDFNIRQFMNLIQLDGYNPLHVECVKFTYDQGRPLPDGLADPDGKLAELLRHHFSPGSLAKLLLDSGAAPESVGPAVSAVLRDSRPIFDARPCSLGNNIDHFIYNLDLIEDFLSIHPDRLEPLLFDGGLTYYDSPTEVLPRIAKYVVVDGQVRQLGATRISEAKRQRIAARDGDPFAVRDSRGAIYQTNLAAQLLTLTVNKAALLDPDGMGIEMEAGKPGWNDALTGLPAIFGSSMPEVYELKRLVRFMLDSFRAFPGRGIRLHAEGHALMTALVKAIDTSNASSSADCDLIFWDTVYTAREQYRRLTFDGIDGAETAAGMAETVEVLEKILGKLEHGIAKAEREFSLDGVPPTYFSREATDFELAGDPPVVKVKAFKTTALPLFLEGPVKALSVAGTPEKAADIHAAVRKSALLDPKLGMYKVNASLMALDYGVGRSRLFQPGWLENESVWLHMEYKYLLELLRSGLHDAFFADFRKILVPFLDPATYGRSILENSSFIASSAHPNPAIHGRGFYARLTGSAAELISMWSLMMAGPRPFILKDGQLKLNLRPALPGGMFKPDGTVSFKFLGATTVTYYNPSRLDTWDPAARQVKYVFTGHDGKTAESAPENAAPETAMRLRDGKFAKLDVFYA